MDELKAQRLAGALGDEDERAAARAEGEQVLVAGQWFAKTVTAILAGATIVLCLGVFAVACIAVVKGIAWAVSW